MDERPKEDRRFLRGRRPRSFPEPGFFPFLMGPGLFALLGGILIASFFVFYRFVLHERQVQAWTDEVAEMQILVAGFHFSLEEGLRGAAGRRDPWRALDRASSCLSLLLAGGDRSGHRRVQPLDDPRLRREVQALGGRLEEVRQTGLAVERSASDGGFTEELDDAFDTSVHGFLASAADLHGKLAATLRRTHERLQTAFLALILGWIAVMGLAVWGLHAYQRRRRKTEAALLDAKRDWESTFDSVPDLIAVLDTDHVIRRVNRAMAERLGIRGKDAVGRKCFEVVHGTREPLAGCPYTCLLSGGSGESRAEIHDERLGGDFLITVSPLRDLEGRLIGAIHVAHEITDRKEAERQLRRAYDEMEKRVESRTAELRETNRWLERNLEELRRTEHRLRESQNRYRSLSQEFNALLDAMHDAILLLAPNLKVIWANRWAEEQLGGDSGGLRGRACHELIHGAASPCGDCPALACFRSGLPEEARRSLADGRILDVRTFPIRGEGGRVENVILVAADVTEKIAIEKEAFRAAHLASIGELAAGVAHEINNPVNGIINYAQLLLNRAGSGSETADLASRILKEGDRVAGIVGSLLSFSRERGENRQPAQVAEILRDSLDLVGSQLEKAGVRLEIDLPADLPLVQVTPQRIQQVFLNLISNARYALDARFPRPDPEKLLEIRGRLREERGGAFVRVVFRDQGSGIPEAQIDRVMDPFFTTKPVGRGTGLGLSISHSIIKEHGGRLTLESLEGRYTAVAVDLPVVAPSSGTGGPSDA